MSVADSIIVQNQSLSSRNVAARSKLVETLYSILFSFAICGSFLASLLADAQAETEKRLFNKKLSELGISVDEAGGNTYIITVSSVQVSKGSSLTSTLEVISGPPRLIIDLKGTQIKKNQTFPLQHTLIKGVRLGVHPDKTRIVLDLSSDQITPPSSTKVGDNSMVISFTLGAKSSEKKPILDSPAPAVPTQGFHQFPPPATATPIDTPPPIKTVVAESTATKAPTLTPTKAATKTPAPTKAATKVPATATPTRTAVKVVTPPSPTNTPTIEATTSLPEHNAAALPVRKVPEVVKSPTSVPATAIPLATETASATIPAPTATPEAEADQPLSSLLKQHTGVAGDTVSDAVLGPKNGTQFLMDLKFDYQIQNHEPLLRLVMMSGANFNLIKRSSQLYELVVQKAGIKSSALAQPQFPPHDFIGFTLVHPKYSDNNLVIEIGVDRGNRITAFSRGNEIWIRAATK